jgi:hypothetical protein
MKFIIFNIIIIILLIGIIVCTILNLIQISKIPGYNGNTALKNGFNFSFLILGFGLFGLFVFTFEIFVLNYNKNTKTRENLLFAVLLILSFIVILIFNIFTILNYKSTYNYIILFLGIFGVILGFVYFIIVNRLPRKLSEAEIAESEYLQNLKAICNIQSQCNIKETKPVQSIESIETSLNTFVLRKEVEPYYDYLL